MSGTKIGGAKAVKAIKEKYGNDWYAKIGRKGGQNSTNGGFAANPKLAKEVASRAGRIGKRGLKFIAKKQDKYYYEDRITGETVICEYNKETGKIVCINKGGNNE